jgi:hypothetical protein
MLLRKAVTTTKDNLLADYFCREELFYQLGLRQFGDFSRIKLDPPPSLREMIEIAVEAENTDTSKLSKSQIVDVSSFFLLHLHIINKIRSAYYEHSFGAARHARRLFLFDDH